MYVLGLLSTIQILQVMGW